MDKRIQKNALGFWEVIEKPTVIELQDYYAQKYYQNANASYELEYSSDELANMQAKLEVKWHILKSHIDTSTDKKMLDVGCGEGYALAFFRDKGWLAKGIDFSAAGVESKNPGCGDLLVTGDLFDLLEKEIESGQKYDVLWLQNVLEHVLEPMDLLHNLRTLIAPGGIAVITVPNDCSSVQMDALNRGHIDHAFWVAPPDHLSYFNAESLTAAAESSGWNCHNIIGDFPVDWYLFHQESNYVRNKKAGKDSHHARVQLENLICKQSSSDDVVAFWEALARVGMGRNVTAFLSPRI